LIGMDESISGAVQRLPERQREALELLAREELSYERIALRMETGVGQVAQLIERGRINLYDEMRGTPLATVAAPSRECERALPAIAAREDGQLEALEVDAAWLDDHLAACERCRPATEQLAEAAAAYRAWAGADDSLASPAEAGRVGGRGRGRWVASVSAAAAALVLAGVATAFVTRENGASSSGVPAADVVSAPADTERRPARRSSGAKRKQRGGEGKGGSKRAAGQVRSSSGDASSAVSAVTGGPSAEAVAAPGGGSAGGTARSAPDRPPGDAGVGPTQQAASRKPSPKQPPPASTPPSQPAAEPAPAAAPATAPAAPPPVVDEPDQPGNKGDPPGHRPDWPRK
jgi:hypothetical protein